MSSFHRIRQSWRRSLGYLGLFGVTTVSIINVTSRYNDNIQVHDAFSNHTRQQHEKHILSEMHDPFITTDLHELELFQKHFSQFSYLFYTNRDILKQKYALKTPVKIRPLKECPVQCQSSFSSQKTLIVGGPPALITGVSMVKTGKDLTYINDERRIPIAFGSAWHLEQDAKTEAPTTYRPTQFLIEQLVRTAFRYVSYTSIQQTGYFPWRTVDWIGWLQHPDHWFTGFKISLAFQWVTMFEDRTTMLKKIAAQCIANENFFEQLDQELNGKLLLQEKGSIIVARTNEEVSTLQELQADLVNEGRNLRILSKEEILQRYGFLPHGLMYGEKEHDRVLFANFMKILNDSIRNQGGNIIDGTLITIYVDDQQSGGIAEYGTPDGQKHYLAFSRLILSLGTQPIINKNNKPLFDVVAARGVSVLAHVYIPSEYRLPPVIVCGGTNHATKLSENPVQVKDSHGKTYDLYLMRFTAGACITPNVSDENAANYDGTIALGLVTAVRRTLGELCRIEPLVVHGCNRQVSRYGQISWIEPYPGIHVQYGAAGGGLTRAPDFVAPPSSHSSSP
ncbi:unnamed protein product [Rotaria sp. Silwood2]|nr:unnamed protein product [Rotaria sp. Silwood2]CAF2602433.1 unnamed protein product [Rotaria sp. Silwood2]CAF2972972.1 unnamed protein product [Rotaria sp. Silwood2]CAF3869094.1 unnamed protein product [Rotaria sp. Silwood2]CAF4082109.1 unnamed protein product [Rotaria sp. Silwood2]